MEPLFWIAPPLVKRIPSLNPAWMCSGKGSQAHCHYTVWKASFDGANKILAGSLCRISWACLHGSKGEDLYF
jgi:hypothetical protein